MLTDSTEWCTLMPTRTSVGEYVAPVASNKPFCMMRNTISSKALFEGAHMRIFERL